MSAKPVLFYSKKNRDSILLWNKLKINNQLNDYLKICVDDNQRVPGFVNTVPSIYIKGRPLIYGQSIEMFLESNNTVMSRNVNTIPNKPTQQVNNSAPQNQPGSDSIGSFNPVEMSERWSDSYSFIDNNPEPLSFCYQFIDDSARNVPNANTNTVTGNNNQIQSRNKNNVLDSRLEKLQRERNMINK
mgnify:CR=1 FL=1|tara:strand:- start:716 stop:1276 length:561 start_codon:yes stop_codon:yes gene_type:complete